MATLLVNKVTRELRTIIQNKNLVVRMQTEGLLLKRKGERWSSAVICPWDAAYWVGMKLRAKAKKLEKKQRRLAKRSLLA